MGSAPAGQNPLAVTRQGTVNVTTPPTGSVGTATPPPTRVGNAAAPGQVAPPLAAQVIGLPDTGQVRPAPGVSLTTAPSAVAGPAFETTTVKFRTCPLGAAPAEVDFTADEVPDLGWFATQEVPALLESSRSV